MLPSGSATRPSSSSIFLVYQVAAGCDRRLTITVQRPHKDLSASTHRRASRFSRWSKKNRKMHNCLHGILCQALPACRQKIIRIQGLNKRGIEPKAIHAPPWQELSVKIPFSIFSVLYPYCLLKDSIRKSGLLANRCALTAQTGCADLAHFWEQLKAGYL